MTDHEFRQHAALAALTGLLANEEAHLERETFDAMAAEAWAIADSMVRAAPAENDEGAPGDS